MKDFTEGLPNIGLSLNDLKWIFWRILHVWFNVYGLACGIVFDEYGENESACKIALYLHQGSDIYAFWIIYNAITMRLLDWRLFTFTIGELSDMFWWAENFLMVLSEFYTGRPYGILWYVSWNIIRFSLVIWNAFYILLLHILFVHQRSSSSWSK